uniref:Uncharacterized protein n=1 Tax=Arundo donax TaxID=35708 RepID=A0A0A8XPY4_ARUDO
MPSGRPRLLKRRGAEVAPATAVSRRRSTVVS